MMIARFLISEEFMNVFRESRDFKESENVF